MPYAKVESHKAMKVIVLPAPRDPRMAQRKPAAGGADDVSRSDGISGGGSEPGQFFHISSKSFESC